MWLPEQRLAHGVSQTLKLGGFCWGEGLQTPQFLQAANLAIGLEVRGMRHPQEAPQNFVRRPSDDVRVVPGHHDFAAARASE